MKDYMEQTTIRLQMELNRKMFEAGKVSRDIYMRANEILTFKLTCSGDDAMISHNESKR